MNIRCRTCIIITYLIIKHEIIIKNLRQFIFMIYKVMNKWFNTWRIKRKGITKRSNLTQRNESWVSNVVSNDIFKISSFVNLYAAIMIVTKLVNTRRLKQRNQQELPPQSRKIFREWLLIGHADSHFVILAKTLWTTRTCRKTANLWTNQKQSSLAEMA